LRNKAASARDLLAQARALRELTRRWRALFFVNDRFDVALAAGADGVHLGPEDLPVAEIRRSAPQGFLIGHSTDIPENAVRAARSGADYIGCGAVFPTSTKADAGSEIGLAGLSRVVDAVGIPVVGIGGVTPAGARRIAEGTHAAGVAVIGAVMGAEDPGRAVEALLEPFTRRQDPS
jgi:thiamine-phosphate pyrophosphorylase